MRLLLVLLLTVLFVAACAPPPPALPAGVTAIDPPRAMTAYTLTNTAGESASLTDFQGRYVLLVYGYTHCPDICPITLGRFNQIKDLLAENAAQAVFVFVSVDPARDTPQRMAEYIGMFDPEIIGLTGEEATITQMIGEYGGRFSARNFAGLRENYTVDHTAASFLLNPEGRWIRTYAYGTDSSVIAADMLMLMGVAGEEG
ncbi:MAG: SCO family protein [Chloroflexi bacterium]|nr:SCO family protein [Chloroflexota bacterium]